MIVHTTNFHHITYKFLFKRLGECTFWTWTWKGDVSHSLNITRLFAFVGSMPRTLRWFQAKWWKRRPMSDIAGHRERSYLGSSRFLARYLPMIQQVGCFSGRGVPYFSVLEVNPVRFTKLWLRRLRMTLWRLGCLRSAAGNFHSPSLRSSKWRLNSKSTVFHCVRCTTTSTDWSLNILKESCSLLSPYVHLDIRWDKCDTFPELLKHVEQFMLSYISFIQNIHGTFYNRT